MINSRVERDRTPVSALRAKRRMRGWTHVGWSLLLPACVVAAAPFAERLEAQAPGARIFGAQVQLILPGGPDLRGELLAVDSARLWLVDHGEQLQVVPVPRIGEVRVEDPRLNSGTITRWSLVAGGLTSAAMLGACLQEAEAGGCLIFVAAWGGVWAGVGWLSSRLILPSRWLSPTETDRLRPFARFPPGLPPGYPQGDSVVTPR